jgi:hypothetical protein
MLKRAFVALAFGAAFIPASAFADAASVAKGCAAGGDCVGLVSTEIAGLDQTCAVKDKAIADLVIAIGNEAQSAQPAVRQKMASAVDTASRSVCDTAQMTRIQQVATAMRNNNDTQTAALGDDATGNTGGAGDGLDASEPSSASAN